MSNLRKPTMELQCEHRGEGEKKSEADLGAWELRKAMTASSAVSCKSCMH